MSSSNSVEEHESTLTFTEKVDILYNEIDLAIKWSRPSILFAVYNSGYMLSKAKADLEDRLTHLNQKIHVIEISGKNQSNFSTEIFQLPRLSHAVLFIDDINCDGNNENPGFFIELKRNLEKFIDNRIRVIFWLSAKQVPLFATNAVECWILRHHVVEFQDDPLQTNALLQTLESTWQEMDENSQVDPSTANAISEIIDSPEKVEANYFHGNLILMLGILFWRKGNPAEARKYINVALGIAKKISHPSLETQCFDALAIVQADPQKNDDTLVSTDAVIPETSGQIASSTNPLPSAGTTNNENPGDGGNDEKVKTLKVKERGIDMKESDLVFDEKTPAEWNEMGNKCLRAGSYNDAISAFTKAIESAPDLSWPYIRNLASAHYHKGKVNGKLSNGKPEQLDVWEGEEDDVEPIVYFNQENIPAAKRGDDPMQDKDNLKPETSSAPVIQAVEAIDLYTPTIENTSGSKQTDPSLDSVNEPPADPLPAKQSIELQSANNTGGESVSLPTGFKPIPKLGGTGPQTSFDWNKLGNSYASRQNYDKAIQAYKKSIEMDPNYGQPYCNLGSVLFQIGNFEDAVKFLKKSLDYLETPEEKALSWNRLGDAYRRLRDYGNAMIAYQKAGQLAPDTNPVLTRARFSLMDNVAIG